MTSITGNVSLWNGASCPNFTKLVVVYLEKSRFTIRTRMFDNIPHSMAKWLNEFSPLFYNNSTIFEKKWHSRTRTHESLLDYSFFQVPNFPFLSSLFVVVFIAVFRVFCMDFFSWKFCVKALVSLEAERLCELGPPRRALGADNLEIKNIFKFATSTVAL